MLSNLVAEIARNKVSRYKIAEVLEVSYGTVNQKINGNYEFSVGEAKKIQEKFFPDLTIEYLFDKEVTQ